MFSHFSDHVRVTLYSESDFLAGFSLKKKRGTIILEFGTGGHIDTWANETGIRQFHYDFKYPSTDNFACSHQNLKKRKSASSLKLFIFEFWLLIHFNSTKRVQKNHSNYFVTFSECCTKYSVKCETFVPKDYAIPQVPSNLTYRHVAKQNFSECATHSQTRSVSSGTSASRRAPSGLPAVCYISHVLKFGYPRLYCVNGMRVTNTKYRRKLSCVATADLVSKNHCTRVTWWTHQRYMTNLIFLSCATCYGSRALCLTNEISQLYLTDRLSTVKKVKM